MRVAFQGVQGAYSQQACREYFAQKNIEISLVPKKEFSGVFKAVQSGSVDFGVVPIENSLAGSIHQNYDLLLSHKIWIAGEYKLRIKHQLIGLPKSNLNRIRTVISHPQALSQCSEYLSSLSQVDVIPHFDTAGAVKDLLSIGQVETAAIAGAEAAKYYGMKILCPSIENHEANYTRFFVLVKNPKRSQVLHETKTKWKTSIVFSLKNIPGGLHKALSVFAIRDIDLFKIESRPLAGSPWKYLFYLDFAGSANDGVVTRTLHHLEEITKEQRILGSYKACH